MTDFKHVLARLNENLNILREREARYGSNAPLDLLNQIADHQIAIALTEQAITGELPEAEWREAMRPLNIDQTIVEGGFFQKIFQALSLPTKRQRDLRNRQIMLQRVHDFWIKGVLENSLYNEVLIELGMEERKGAVDYPWDMVIQGPDQPNRQLASGTKIIDVFDESGGSLLILGEPGSGKTTMLLELARQLIIRAQVDPTQPMPVVFNLSSWMEKRLPLTEWLVEELSSKYSIPQKVARPWIENDEILPLLDGLDEVSEKFRIACAQAINTFNQSGLFLIAVCARIADYEVLSIKLKLQQAIFLQPLTRSQIENYLAQFGVVTAIISSHFHEDSDFQDLARSPLMLNIMVLIYNEITSHSYRIQNEFHFQPDRLFQLYVIQMFERRRTGHLYSPNRTVTWLTWLAQMMKRNEQSVFLIEGLQKSWLPTEAQLQKYYFLVKVVFRLIILLVYGFTGMTMGWLKGLPILGIIFGLIGGLGPIWWIRIPIIIQRDIRPIDRLKWSRRKIFLALTPWLLPILVGIGLGFVTGSWFELSMILSVTLVWVFSFGLYSEEIDTKIRPNYRIIQTLKYWLTTGLLCGLLSGLIAGFGLGLIRFSESSHFLNEGLIFGFSIGMMGGLGVGMTQGGEAVVKHYLLRVILLWNNCTPWKLIPFLDYCVDRIFLRKVGGGYIFIHRYLMEYFASLTPEDIERLSQKVKAT